MKYLPLYILFFWFSMPVIAQQMQWASEVVDKSSQYGNEVYSANHVLGVPNAINGNSTEMMAWAPAKKESNLGEHIHVRFGVEMQISQVVVVESKNPGAIKRITAFDERKKRHIIFENQNPQPISESNRYFSHTFSLTDYKVSEVLVELKTSAILGSNQIDAIGISASDISYKKQVVEEVLYSKGPSNAEDLGLQINSTYAERLPIISPDGKTLYFARKYHPQNRGEEDFDDIWVSYLQKGNTWSRPVNIGPPLNNNEHNFVVATSPAGDVLWLGNEYNSSKKDGISYSQKFGRTWSRPKNVRIADHYNDSDYVCYHVSIDERILLMSVQRKDGLGDRDLYVSFRLKNGEFSKPKNLGTTINTVGMESSVFLAADGKTIYFASNGHSGYGGLDMFRSQRLDDSWTNWTKPINLGKDINTPQNDYNYTIPASGDFAYFSRDVASGMSDLYRIKLPKEIQPDPVVFIKGQLVDSETGAALGGVLKYENSKQKNNPNELLSDESGRFSMILPYGENVEIYAEKSGYYAISDQMRLAEQSEELDFDGGNVSENVNKIGSSAVDEIKLQLNELENDLADLESKPKTNISLKNNNTRNLPYTSDADLLALKRRYEAKIFFLEENRPSSEKENFINKGEEDDELAAMKRQFNKENGQEVKIPPRGRKPVISSEKEEEDELAAMKRKFNKMNGGDNDDENEFLSKSGNIEYLEFVELEKKTWEEVEKELLPEVHRDLQKELLKETKRELAQEFSSKEREALQKLNPELDVMSYSKPGGVRSTTTRELDWAAEIKTELREILKEEVRIELRKELRAEVKAELRRELEIQVKKELEIELRKELEEKIRAEILAEKKNTKSQEPQQNPIVSTEEEALEIIEEVYKEIEKEVLLAPIKVGQIIPMNNIFFDSNEDNIKPESHSELERVAAFLESNSNLIIEVGGHTNGWCSHVFANELSTDRAKEVRKYLVSKGIAENRIQFRGYGKTQPVASNDTKNGRRKNQRVEMKILDIL